MVARASAFARRSAARPNDLVRNGRPLRDSVLAHEEPVVPVGVDVEHLAAADPGGDAVGRGSTGDRAVDDRTCRSHRRQCSGIDLDLRATSRDGEHIVEREGRSGQDDT